MPILSWILLLVTVLLWLGLVVTIAQINASDAAGNGMSYSFGMIMAIVLWCLLAVLMLIAAKKGEMPGWVNIAALLLLPLSLAAGMATINLLYRRGADVSGWPIVVPAAVPLLIVSFVVWATVPTLRAAFPEELMSRAVWGAILVLSLLPWPLLREKNRRVAALQIAYEAAGRAGADSAEQALEAQFQSLSAGTPLREWLVFATAGNDLRERTLAGIRTLPRRQAEAEALTGPDLAMLMYELRNLDLKATSALCATTREFLVAHAESFRAKAPLTARYEIEGSAIETYLFAMQWLGAHDCDLTTAVDSYDSVVRLFPASADREQFLSRLASLRRAPR
ncbi:MAG: hypothetical protein ABI587_10570 [Gemmatimonadales bacterium]